MIRIRLCTFDRHVTADTMFSLILIGWSQIFISSTFSSVILDNLIIKFSMIFFHVNSILSGSPDRCFTYSIQV